MGRGVMRSMLTGMMVGGVAATMFGIMNWQTERKWNRQMRRCGRWLSHKTDEIAGKF